MVVGCLAAVKTIIGLTTDCCTYSIYDLINGLLHKTPYIPSRRYGNISATM